MRSNWVKLGDFGIAKVLEHTKQAAKTVVGTPYYLSPEIIENKAYSFPSDIWSLGVLLYEMASLKPPFDAGSLHDLAKKILAGWFPPLPKFYSENFNLLVSTLLQVDPKKRPNINQILKFPLLADKIPKFLEEDIFKEEFSHTIMHRQKFFDAKGNPIKKPAPLSAVPEEGSDATQEQYNNYVNYIKQCINTEDENYVDQNQYPAYPIKKLTSEDWDGTYDGQDDAEHKEEEKSTRPPETYNFDEVDFDVSSLTPEILCVYGSQVRSNSIRHRLGDHAKVQGWQIHRWHWHD